MRLLSPEELDRLLPAETHAFRGPVPTQIVSSEEYFPSPQTAAQQHGFAPLGEPPAVGAARATAATATSSGAAEPPPRAAAAQGAVAGPTHTQT
ncbi:MAG: hypothetical protein WEG40_17005 [Candidatus Rokuibacteriota bacterium]